MNLAAHRAKTASLNAEYRPELLRLDRPRDNQRFLTLLTTGQVFLHDEIEAQLMELIRARHPSVPLDDRESRRLAREHAGERLEEYGVWVYYPWNGRLVHSLDEKEFAEVRTVRNKYKITQEEQQTLLDKKVGVIGLSVGQSVALCIAMERAAGELRLADFDTLELTNLNRIRTGIANLGLKKAVATAREIAELDPFLKVRVFDEGLNEENLDAFFLEGGKLDAVIDECDGIAIKISCRSKARELRVPVLMEASDRCTIDIERFDLEPDRPLLHGYIDHLDVSRVKELKTNEEKVPYLAPMVGVDTMSPRLKASALEVGHSITTWPQLASAVVMGGGALADVWRRIALNLFRQSGRYFIDVESIIGEPRPLHKPREEDVPAEALTQGIDLQKAQAVVNRFFYQPNHTIPARQPGADLVRNLVRAAAAAPSGGNSQPWRWIYRQGYLFLFLDRPAGYSYMNYRDSASYIALGAAIENLVLAAHQHRLRLLATYFPLAGEGDLVAAFRFHEAGEAAIPEQGELEQVVDGSLAGLIEKRHTNRKVPPRTLIPGEILHSLKEVAEQSPGIEVKFIDSAHELLEAGKIIGITDRYRILHPESNYDFIHREIRWTEADAARSRTGIEVSTLELKESELLGLRFIRDREVISFLSKINGGQLLKNASVKNAAAASAFTLLTVPGFSAGDFLNGGRAGQRLWLKATQLGLAVQPMNVPLAYFTRLKHGIEDLPPGTEDELQDLYARFTHLFGSGPAREEVYLFRLFKAEEPQSRSYRRRVDDILSCV